MRMRLRPSLVRACMSVIVLLASVTASAYFWQGYHEHYWWSRDYVLSSIAPIAVWLMFVPSRLEFSDMHFIIQLPFRRLYTLEWSDLRYYGPGENVFMIQFSSVGTFQIFAQAFRRSEWRMLTNFLSSTFPERKASGYIGGRMFKWPRKKT